MGVLLKIAYRNLREHKIKTLIIGSIIALGLLILVVGNSLVDTAAEGVRSMYTSNFTGQVMITSSRFENPSLFMSPGMSFDEPTPIIQDYAELLEILAGLDGVAAVPQISGFAIAGFDEEGSGFLQLFSVDPEEYQQMFPDSFEMLAGRFLEGDEEGLVLSVQVAEILSESAGRKIQPGDSLLLTNMNVVSGTKIREVEVKGIFRFKKEAPNLTMISFLDLASMRVLSGMTRVTDVQAELTAREQASLGVVNEDDLFGSGDLVGAAAIITDTPSTDALLGILGDLSGLGLYRELDTEAWHYVLLKLDNESRADRLIRSLNAHFQEQGIPLQANNWVQAAGAVAKLVNTLKIVFNGLILVVGIVALIIIMNTLVISVTERIGEIGTMRAIGAERPFIRWMITLETMMISLVFGAVGIAIGGIIIAVLHNTGIEATNMFMQVFFGGSRLVPVLNPGSVLLSFVMVVLVGILASLYPVAVALRIDPVRAMNQH